MGGGRPVGSDVPPPVGGDNGGGRGDDTHRARRAAAGSGRGVTPEVRGVCVWMRCPPPYGEHWGGWVTMGVRAGGCGQRSYRPPQGRRCGQGGEKGKGVLPPPGKENGAGGVSPWRSKASRARRAAPGKPCRAGTARYGTARYGAARRGAARRGGQLRPPTHHRALPQVRGGGAVTAPSTPPPPPPPAGTGYLLAGMGRGVVALPSPPPFFTPLTLELLEDAGGEVKRPPQLFPPTPIKPAEPCAHWKKPVRLDLGVLTF